MPIPRQNQGNEFGDLISQMITSEGDTFYHHYDALGSTAALTDSAGVVTDEYDFEAFGEAAAESGATPNPYLWVARSGYRYDEETGLYDIRRRKYAKNSGRFVSEDPVRSDEHNLYRYVANQPVMRRDPSGLQDPQIDDDPRFLIRPYRRSCVACHWHMTPCGNIDWDSLKDWERDSIISWCSRPEPEKVDVVTAGNQFHLLQYIEDALLEFIVANISPSLEISIEAKGVIPIGIGIFLTYGIELKGALTPCRTKAGGLDAEASVGVTGFIKLVFGGSLAKAQPEQPKAPKKPSDTKKLSKKQLEQWKRDRERHKQKSKEFQEKQAEFEDKCRFQVGEPEVGGKGVLDEIGDCPDDPFSVGFGLFAKFVAGIWIVSYTAQAGCEWKWDCSLGERCHPQKPKQPKCSFEQSVTRGKTGLAIETGFEIFGKYSMLVFS